MIEKITCFPSDQTDAFAEEVVNKTQMIAKKYDITFAQALEAYKIGAYAQHNDMLSVISNNLYKLADEAFMMLCESVADGTTSVADALYSVAGRLGKDKSYD